MKHMRILGTLMAMAVIAMLVTCSVSRIIKAGKGGSYDTIEYKTWSVTSHSEHTSVERYFDVAPIPRYVFISTDTGSHPTAVVQTEEEEWDSLEWQQKVYERDSVYKICVSGYEVELDSVIWWQKMLTISDTTFIYRDTKIQQKESPWGLGVTAGLTATPKGLAPGITLGVTYRFDIGNALRKLLTKHR